MCVVRFLRGYLKEAPIRVNVMEVRHFYIKEIKLNDYIIITLSALVIKCFMICLNQAKNVTAGKLCSNLTYILHTTITLGVQKM